MCVRSALRACTCFLFKVLKDDPVLSPTHTHGRILHYMAWLYRSKPRKQYYMAPAIGQSKGGCFSRASCNLLHMFMIYECSNMFIDLHCAKSTSTHSHHVGACPRFQPVAVPLLAQGRHFPPLPWLVAQQIASYDYELQGYPATKL